MRRFLALPLLALALPAAAQDMPTTPAGKQALELLTKGIAFPTVEGRGQVPAYATYLKQQLVSAGFADADVAFTPLGETGYLTARLPGRDRAAKPTIVLAHMDVVEANPAFWTRDPFVPVVEKGYVFGRGALDNKANLSLVVATLMKLKREGWVPKRDLVLLLTGDEETQMKTTAAAAERFKDAALVLNADAGRGQLDAKGKPESYGLQAAEKVYGDYRLTITDPGGHSSRPGPTNAIASMAAAVGRIAGYRFPAQINEITKAYFLGFSAGRTDLDSVAMRSFAEDQGDPAVADYLSTSPGLNGILRTTCVPTMIAGGHAPNALPQRVTANINCRIFPGTSRAAIKAKLVELVADPRIGVEWVDNGTLEAGASPLDPKVMAAVRAAVAKRAPGIPVLPAMEAGATDSMHFRARGIPAFGVGGVFMKGEDVFAHGLNERIPVATIDPGVVWWEGLLKALG